MALLNFKMGKYGGLDAVAKKAGTVYITTDERAMYVDTSDETRIRIGRDLIIYESVGSPEIAPPFSTDALYYFEAEKALMKYTGEEWVQLNSTKELSEALTAKIETAQETADAAATAAAAAQETADAAATTAAAANTNAESRLLKSDFESFKTENTTAVADAKAAGDQGIADAASAAAIASAAQSAADAAKDEADKKAPINHASNDDTYGLGNSTNYGHVKLSDAVSDNFGVTDGTAATPAAVKTAYDKAEAAATAAQKAQKTADDNAATIQAHDNKIAALEAGTYDDTEVRNLIVAETDRATEAESALDTKIGSVDGKVDSLNAAVTANKSEIDSTITGINNKIGAESDATTASTVYGYVNKQKEASDKALTTAKNELQTNINSKADQSALDALSAVVATKADKDELTALETKLNKNITNEINAANAMTYKGIVGPTVVETEDATHFKALPTTNVSVGDTYVAAEDLTGTVTARIGDLIIANGHEGDDGIIDSGLTWQVVPTGYSSTTDPSLVVADNTVTLQNAAAQSLGKVTFAAATDSSLKVSTENNIVTYSIEWGTF